MVADRWPRTSRSTAEPFEVAGACLYLASPLASYVSGATLEVHGGGEPPAPDAPPGTAS